MRSKPGAEIACLGCGARVPDVEGPTHRYLGASPGCWAVFGEVLAREYSDFRYGRAHQLAVDAYAAQHPGEPSPQTIQSVAVHLLSLYWILERGRSASEAARGRQRVAVRKSDFVWLAPPSSPGEITVVDVQAAASPEAHLERAHDWARSVWDAWSEHHETVRRWAQR